MGKTDTTRNNNGQPGAVENEAATSLSQLTFFDTVMPPTMISENSSEHMHSEAGSPASDSTAVHDLPQQATGSDADPAAESRTDCNMEVARDEQPSDQAPALQMSESLGQRLRATREARGLRIEEAAQQMKLPLGTVQALEADRHERIGEGIYLRSYLTKYLRLLDLPLVLAERATQHAEPPPLITSGTISRPRYLFERYSSSALYLILTAVIVVPAVWLAMRGGFDSGIAQITPLDGPDAAAISSAQPQSSTVTTKSSNAAASDAAEHPNDEAPLVASLAPFPALKRETAETTAAEKAAAGKTANMPLSAGEHSLRLTLAEPSWVEIVTADGEKLEYGLLPAGAVRSYHSAKAIDVRLGNSSGAAVQIDGKNADIAPFRHSNVAHFRFSSGEVSLSHSGG